MKKILFNSLMLVAMVATMSVGFTSCSKDDDDGSGEVGISTIQRKWTAQAGATVEFKKDNTVNFVLLNGTTPSGKYTVLDISNTRYEDDKAVLFKLDMDQPITIGSTAYQQLYVYYYPNNNIVVKNQICIVAYPNKNAYQGSKLGYFQK